MEFVLKRALAPDRNKIIEYAKTCGGEDYSAEVQAAFANNPITCYIATKDKELIGFACFEATAKNFFGPMAVSEEYRKHGIGKVLLLRSLYSMSEMGYGYAIIGWPTKSAIPFYEKCGFERSHIVKNFFTDNYDHPIYECGVQLVDMVYLKMDIKNK